MTKKKPIKLSSGTIDLESMKVVETTEVKQPEKLPIEVIGGTIKLSSNEMEIGDSYLIEFLGKKMIVEKSEDGIIEIIEVKNEEKRYSTT